ncbi:hypothetical protein DYB28_014685, partial [Aphanomyces astaci]
MEARKLLPTEVNVKKKIVKTRQEQLQKAQRSWFCLYLVKNAQCPDVKDVDSRNTHEDTKTILACRQDASTEDFVLAEGQGLPTRSGRKGFVLAQGQGLPTQSGCEDFVLAEGQGLPTR